MKASSEVIGNMEMGYAPQESGALALTGQDSQGTSFGALALLFAGASMTVCYISKISALVLPLVGLSVIEMNPHIQALAMWAFALVAVIALARDRRSHAGNVPLTLGILGFVLIVGTLYTYYEVGIETLGYVLLGAAAFLNQNYMLEHLHRAVAEKTRKVEQLNGTLERRVAQQVGEIERLARLKRFLAPAIADLITTEGKESLLDSHRSCIACLFCDIRNFTALSEGVEPEEVMHVLQNYHNRLGRLVEKHGATIGYRSGDGLMVFLNDPLPCDEPARDAILLASKMIETFDEARVAWEKLGYNVGIGIGIASGYATLGLIGEEGRFDYTAIGSVVNLASRLCDHATDGEILINRRAYVEIDGQFEVALVDALDLKGFEKPVEAYRLIQTH